MTLGINLCHTDPPSTPIISGYTEGSVIPAGSSQKLLCMSSGGNPPATLTWFKNDKKVNKTWREGRKSYELIMFSRFSIFSPSERSFVLLAQINSQTKTINNSVQSELNIIANITDNQAIYRCEAQNSATDVPLLDSKILSVHCKYTWTTSDIFVFTILDSYRWSTHPQCAASVQYKFVI